MYKLILLMVTMLLISTLTGCSRVATSPAITPSVAAAKTAVGATSAAKSSTSGSTAWKTSGNSGNDFTHSYDITPQLYAAKDGVVNIYYASISGMKDAAKQDDINALLKQELDKYTKSEWLTSPDSISSYSINIDIIVATDHLLSMTNTGDFFGTNAAHPMRWMSTINIDLDSGTNIDIKSMINLNSDMLALIREGKYDLLGYYDYCAQSTDEQILQDFSKNDYDYYFTYDSIGIITNLPYVMGSYTLFEIKYKDIIPSIRNTGKYWPRFEALSATDISTLLSRGCRPDMLQSYWTEFKNFGKVFFLTCETPDKSHTKVEFYLASMNKLLYRFPEFYGNQFDLYSIKAVSFTDVNNDGLEDIIIISDKAAGVYIQKGNEFVSLPGLDKQINDAKQNASIGAVVEYLKGRAW